MFVALVVLVMSAAVMTSGVLADARINVVDHFGGDVLYCNQTDGCRVTNAQGDVLGAVPQAVIDSAVQAACDTGVAQHVEVGEGTYGALTLVVTCPNSVMLVGYDEWGKQHTMTFTTAYLPVNAPGAGAAESSDCLCEVDLDANGFDSVDGIHSQVGYDVWSSDEIGNVIAFLYWTATSPGYPPCNVA
jgi:hypothetical protein